MRKIILLILLLSLFSSKAIAQDTLDSLIYVSVKSHYQSYNKYCSENFPTNPPIEYYILDTKIPFHNAFFLLDSCISGVYNRRDFILDTIKKNHQGMFFIVPNINICGEGLLIYITFIGASKSGTWTINPEGESYYYRYSAQDQRWVHEEYQQRQYVHDPRLRYLIEESIDSAVYMLYHDDYSQVIICPERIPIKFGFYRLYQPEMVFLSYIDLLPKRLRQQARNGVKVLFPQLKLEGSTIRIEVYQKMVYLVDEQLRMSNLTELTFDYKFSEKTMGWQQVGQVLNVIETK